MKRALTKPVVALFGFTALAMFVLAEQQPQDVLGKINFSVLYDAAPAMPASTAEAGKRAYGTDLNVSLSTADFSPFYELFSKRVAAARDVIKGAVDARPANQEAMAQRAKTEADNNAIISRMGGTEKISQMSEQEQQAAAMQAMGSYQQSMAGGHQETSNAMQAVMQRVMNDPEYRERFEKMTPEQQEAEMRKAMGPSAPVAQHTAAEQQRAMKAPNEMAANVARQNDIAALLMRMVQIEDEFTPKDKAITAAPGSHEQIAGATQAKIAKLPIIPTAGEADPGPDPAKVKALQREQATLDRARAAAELQQRTALYAERRAKYKELAASYAAWLKQSSGPSSNASANLVSDASSDTALRCEERLINLAESLRKYHEDATRDAAYYEQAFQKKMTEL